MAHKIPLPETVEEVEVLAGRRAVALALKVGTHEVELEGDAELIIKALFTNDPCMAVYGHIIQDIKFTASTLRWSRFQHVKRQCNLVAHALARKAKDLET